MACLHTEEVGTHHTAATPGLLTFLSSRSSPSLQPELLPALRARERSDACLARMMQQQHHQLSSRRCLLGGRQQHTLARRAAVNSRTSCSVASSSTGSRARRSCRLRVQASSIDDEREAGRRYRRAVFDSVRWQQHRSTSRYFRYLDRLLTSRIIRGLFGPMSYVASLCTTVGVYHSLLDWHVLQQLAPDSEWPTLALNSSGIFSISTFALSLLLVFRTNSSYERWWEARDCWRMIVNECTHLARQTEQWLPGPGPEPVRAALLRWLQAFPLALMDHLREEGKLADSLEGVLRPDEARMLLASPNPPLFVLSAVGQLLAVADMRVESKTHMDESVRVLQEAAGSCEKIITTPIPISYTRHTGRFLVLWITCLPFVIWQELGWLSIPVSMMVTFLLFGIEEIGVQVEEPFGILALEHYCEEVDQGIHQATTDAALLHDTVTQLAAQCRPHAQSPPPAAAALAPATAAAIHAAAAAAGGGANGHASGALSTTASSNSSTASSSRVGAPV